MLHEDRRSEDCLTMVYGLWPVESTIKNLTWQSHRPKEVTFTYQYKQTPWVKCKFSTTTIIPITVVSFTFILH